MRLALPIYRDTTLRKTGGTKMLDFLFTCGQVLCLAGYLYGAYLVIKHSDAFKSNEGRERERFAPKPDSHPQAELFARGYRGYDS